MAMWRWLNDAHEAEQHHIKNFIQNNLQFPVFPHMTDFPQKIIKQLNLSFNSFQEREILNTLMVPAKVFLALVTTLEDHYVKDNPFHNSLHAADVTQSTNVLLNTPALENVFTPLEICAALFAACVHDVDHPGLTNQFLINSSELWAASYCSGVSQKQLFACRFWAGNYV